jgi:hypothetical protein
LGATAEERRPEVKRPPKTRNTVQKRIVAQQDKRTARQIAIYGRALLPIESAAASCIAMLRSNRGRTAPAALNRFEAQVASELKEQAWLSFVAGDAGAFRRIADMLEKWNLSEPAADPTAEKLIALGELCGRTSLLTMDKIAEYMRYPGSEDNFSALRKLCKKLGVPYAKARKGRPKNADTQAAE